MYRNRIAALVLGLGAVAFLGGCASTSDLDSVRAEVKAVSAKADKASADASAALAAANRAEAAASDAAAAAREAAKASRDVEAKLNRAHTKGMYK